MSKEFKIRIGLNELAAITEKTENRIYPQELAQAIYKGLTIQDLRTATVLFALKEYLEERRCEPDFELVLNE